MTKSTIPLFISIIVATFALCAYAAEGNSCPAIGTPAAEIPFTLIGGHIYTEAMVNRRGPYRFIVDTGGVKRG